MPEVKHAIELEACEWQHIAVALGIANLEYLRRTLRNQRRSEDKQCNPDLLERAKTAADLCNRICDEVGLDDVFRMEE